jgi:UDP-N-acetyl-D-mannosaminuronic acid transferase (WecB/TagA/CpsF family)
VGQIHEWNNAEIVETIRAARPDLLLLALGFPKQEQWESAYHQKAGVPLSIGIGASLDFICGKQKRAPLWMQKTGLEWLFRLLTNPSRLTRRYYKDLVFLVTLTWRQAQALRSMRRQWRASQSTLHTSSLQVDGSTPEDRHEPAPLFDCANRKKPQ